MVTPSFNYFFLKSKQLAKNKLFPKAIGNKTENEYPAYFSSEYGISFFRKIKDRRQWNYHCLSDIMEK